MRPLPLLLCLLLPACGARTPLTEGSEESGLAPAKDAQPDAVIDAVVSKSDCTDPSVTYVYVVTDKARIHAFRPAAGTFTQVGMLDCPATGSATPFSMGVDRKGNAFVVYSDGTLFRVSTATGHCEKTPFAPGSQGFGLFGMGFATDQGGPSEKLYLAASALDTTSGIPRLGWLDTTNYEVHPIALLPDTGMELTGTGDGRLYAFFDTGIDAHLAQIDKQNGSYVSDTILPGVSKGSAWAFAFWGGDFWFFTAPETMLNASVVTRYQPSTASIKVVGQLAGELIVGAGVSTCAPEQ